MWWILAAQITGIAPKKEPTHLLKKLVKCISFPLTKITAFFKSGTLVSYLFVAKNKLSQPDVKLIDALIWYRKDVSCVFALLLYSWGAFLVEHGVQWIGNVFSHDFCEERLFIPRTLVLGIFISHAGVFTTRFLLTVYNFLSTRVTYPRLEHICHCSQVVSPSKLIFPFPCCAAPMDCAIHIPALFPAVTVWASLC